MEREKILRKPKVDVPIDLWTNYDVDERLMQEIKEKGVVVYEWGDIIKRDSRKRLQRRSEIMRLAEIKDLERVLQITSDTISDIYSHYYAEGVVNFFLKHHSRENILSDIEKGLVWLLEENGCPIGTVTIKKNAVNRLFVLPDYQSRGYGSRLMDFAEDKIAEKYSCVHIDSSLPAKEMYLKRGYKEKKTCKIQADNGDILIYDEMEKHCQQALLHI